MSAPTEAHATIAKGSKPDNVRITNWVLGGFAFYLAAQLALRLFISPVAELDESEQLVLTQQISLVYGSQPPLYTWLQWAVFQVTGVGILGLALLKNLLLFATYGGTYGLTLSISADPKKAALATLLLLLIPQIVWESQRDLTHSVLVTTVSVWTLLALRFLQKNPTASRFALLGLIAGTGLLSKYNYALFAVALIPAVLLCPGFRVLFRRPAALLVPVTALAAAGPHLLAAFRQSAKVTADVHKFGIEDSSGGFSSILGGLGELGVAVASYLGPLLLVGLIVLIHRLRTRGNRSTDNGESSDLRSWRKLLGLTAAFAVAACVLLAVFAGVTEFKDRWMQPLLFFAPILLVLWIRGPVGKRVLGTAVGAAILVGLVVFSLIFGRTCISSRGRLAFPFPEFAAAIRTEGLPTRIIIGGDRYIAGNMRLVFPEAVVLSPETPPVYVPIETPFLAAWQPRKDGRNEAAVRSFLPSLLPVAASPDGQPVTLEAERLYAPGETDLLEILSVNPTTAHE